VESAPASDRGPAGLRTTEAARGVPRSSRGGAERDGELPRVDEVRSGRRKRREDLVRRHARPPGLVRLDGEVRDLPLELRRQQGAARVRGVRVDEGRVEKQGREVQPDGESEEGPPPTPAEALDDEGSPGGEERDRRNEEPRSPSAHSVPGPPGRGGDEEDGEGPEAAQCGETDRGGVLPCESATEADGREGRGREEDEEAAVRAHEKPPEAVWQRVGEALAAVAPEGGAEPGDLEREPDAERCDRAERARDETPAAQGRGGGERQEEEGGDRGEARLQEDGEACGGTGAEGEAGRDRRPKLQRRRESQHEGAAEGRGLQGLGEVGRGVGPEGGADPGENDGERGPGERGPCEPGRAAGRGGGEEDGRERGEQEERLRGPGTQPPLGQRRGQRRRKLRDGRPEPVARHGVSAPLDGPRSPLGQAEPARLDERDGRLDHLSPVGDLARVPVVCRQREDDGDEEKGPPRGPDGPGALISPLRHRAILLRLPGRCFGRAPGSGSGFAGSTPPSPRPLRPPRAPHAGPAARAWRSGGTVTRHDVAR
jgi:hypothetical protein